MTRPASRGPAVRSSATARSAILTVLALAWFLPARASAQTTAALVGTVEDASGARLPDVRIMLTNPDTSAVRRADSDPDGRFVFAALPAGDYVLRAELAGYRSLVREGIRLVVGEQAALALVLPIGVAEEVHVVAPTPQLHLRSSELSALVDQRTIEGIPINGRNFTELVALQPGVNPFPHRDNGSVVAHGLAMSVNGQDPRANVYLLDGTLTNDFTNGPAGSAAGTALGMDTVREFRVQASTYRAEFGRNVGGQINAITKAGTNEWTGGVFEYHRNDALDARNYFDVGAKPGFARHQFGGTIGGPIRRDRLFLFGGYESLRESLGRTIVTTVPDDDARTGALPSGPVTIDPAIRPYLDAFPRANGEALGGGLARYTFPFDQRLVEHFGQARLDAVLTPNTQLFARHTLDDAEQRLPTDYPQFPRAFVSRNQFFTAELRQVLSSAVIYSLRAGYSRTRLGQQIEAATEAPLPVFVPGRPLVGSIDIGGLPRFGTQASADVRLGQDVFAGQCDLTQARGRHLLAVGGLVEHYRDDEFNPTFSLGIFRFANLSAFLRNQPTQFIGLTPAGDLRRHWNWTLVGAYLQDDLQLAPDLTINAGLRLEWASLPVDIGGRDVNLRDLLGPPEPGPLYDNPPASLSPRLGAAWKVDGSDRTSLRGGYGLYYNTDNQQNLIITITNPPATPRVIIANPTFPVPPFERGTGVSVRPIQYDIRWPRVHMWNVTLERQLGGHLVVGASYAGARGRHLWRNSDVNVPTPTTLPDGTRWYPVGLTRPNPAFSAIELKSSDGDSWYRALILDVRRRWSHGLQLQSSYTWSKAEDTTQNSTFFSDSTTAATSAMPEFIPGYNRGLSDFHAAHNWVATFVWELPRAARVPAAGGALLNGWRVSGLVRLRSGNPLTPMLQTNRSRSLWSPSLGPGTGPDRPSYAPGRNPGNAVTGDPAQWFDRDAFVLPAAGTYGNVGRNELIGPGFGTVDLAISRRLPVRGSAIDLRLEIFNLLNRANFGPPSLIAFAGTSDNETPLASFGQIRTTVTSARQAQIGVRWGW